MGDNHEHRWDDHLEPGLANDREGNPIRVRVWYRKCRGCEETRTKKVVPLDEKELTNVKI